MDLKARIRNGIDLDRSNIVEIGPLYRPFVLKSEAAVMYVDWADTETLRQRYKDDSKFDVSTIVDVDAIWGEQSLSDCLNGFTADYVIASHVIEHVPDMLTWLSELRAVLRASGEIRLVIPDKRFTFDFIRRETLFPDIVDAFLRKPRTPLPRCILDHVYYVRGGVDVSRAWSSGVCECDLEVLHPFELAYVSAKDNLENGTYHDVHCWVFTPHSFATLMREAAQVGFTDLACVYFEDTLINSLEFCVYLRPCQDRDQLIESWAKIERASLHEPHRSTQYIEQSALLTDKNLLAHALANAQEKMASAEALAQSYRTSLSWRLTAPLRALRRALRF